MELNTVLPLVLVFSCSCLPLLPSQNIIKAGESINANQKLVSAGGSFAGLLHPKESPIPENSTAVFTIGDDGNMSIKECETQCIRNFSCSAYACSKNACFIWIGNLLDLAHDFTSSRALFVRFHGSELITDGLSGNSAQRHKILIEEIVSAIFAILILINRMDGNSAPVSSVLSGPLVGKDDMKLVQYSLHNVRDATNNFHEDNKL
ncbi:hypothetical protein RND71_012275 [Anisodus tanguticus]|uniref:Apple domain-containing protein n=1 Tax=Anisodus tanguticus TaxID=243964 RepID=A0AAE1VFU2_9SOLA|nr:hypothetical protein RND71_012275 [Anisodus tanguticus]